ncbi:DUF6879 family protein [Microtetraspora niveoalba]|uniref:DUF6879 family protein n=1 Tax=Microtetraspora niveoalba TaxID=46175 RepID=UPI00082FEAF8|nr:DUF6879 family protein [Microtetraspora niveoalba]
MAYRIFDRVHTAYGDLLNTNDYRADFSAGFHEIEGPIWKLERAQNFDEGSDPSWNAMLDGDWERSKALLEESRPDHAADLPARGELRRLRIVEWPLTPYMQWELHLLAMRARLGERGRALAASDVAFLEPGRPLPELVVFRTDLMYQVLYDATGTCVGARRITDAAVIEPCVTQISTLYGGAEEMAGYVEREVAPLPPPRGARA